MLARCASCLTIAWVLATPVLAATVDAPAVGGRGSVDSEEQQGSAGGVIVVTGVRDFYGADSTGAATRTDTLIRNVPQAISVITERQIDDQAMRSIADALRHVPGAMIGQGEGHRDQITLRGNNSTADFFIDGLRDDIQYYRPLYNLHRIEILRGPNAMIFGRGGGGGVVNRIPEVPLFDPSFGVSASADTFGAWHVDADLNQPLARDVAARFNAVYEEFANNRDVYEGRLIAINPTLRVLPGPNTGINLSYEYLDDERVVDRGIPAGRAGTLAEPALPLTGFRDTFFGARGVNRLGFEAHILRATLEHRFTPDLTLVSRLLHADYNKFYRNAFSATAVTTNAAGVRQVGIEAYFDAFQRQNLFSQTDLVWHVTTGPASHTILAGIEYGNQETGNQRLNGFFDSGVPTTQSGRRTTVNVADPIVIPPITYRAGTGQRGTTSGADILAFYIQDQVRIGPIELIAGLRHDRLDITVRDLITGIATERADNLWSPRVGLVLHPGEQVSIYGSYSRSYLPQSGDQFNSLDVTGANLAPERFDNVEIGVKWEPRAGLLLSAAAYRLDRTNTRAAGPNPGEILLTGAQRSRGIELEAAGRIARNWQLSFGFALQEAEIRRTTSAAPAGRAAPQVPRHLLSLWTRYDFSPRLGAGIGLHHQSESFASISNIVVLPSYTRVDAAFFVRLSEGVEAQVNVENLFGETYFPTANNDNNITTGSPIGARGTLRLRF